MRLRVPPDHLEPDTVATFTPPLGRMSSLYISFLYAKVAFDFSEVVLKYAPVSPGTFAHTQTQTELLVGPYYTPARKSLRLPSFS